MEEKPYVEIYPTNKGNRYAAPSTPLSLNIYKQVAPTVHVEISNLIQFYSDYHETLVLHIEIVLGFSRYKILNGLL